MKKQKMTDRIFGIKIGNGGKVVDRSLADWRKAGARAGKALSRIKKPT